MASRGIRTGASPTNSILPGATGPSNDISGALAQTCSLKFFSITPFFVEKRMTSNQDAHKSGLVEGVHINFLFHGGTRMAKKKAKKKATKKKAKKKAKK
jgi:hypothetical protein